VKELVEYLASALVDDPAPVDVTEAGPAEDRVYRLKVGRDDLGKVIGKKGRTAKALRTLLAAAGAKQNTRVTLEIVEPDAQTPSDDAPATGEADAAGEEVAAGEEAA
jgi:predicted RNA-binding protein YlqC (UPF0109 family)